MSARPSLMIANPWRRITDWPGLLTALGGGRGFVRLHRPNERVTTRRAAVERSSAIFLYSYGRRKWGERYFAWPVEWNGYPVSARPARNGSATDQIIRDLTLWSDYVLRHTRPGVWDELRAQAAAVTERTIRALTAAIAAGAPERTALHQLGLPELDRPHPTTTLRYTTTLRSQGAPADIIEQGRAAFDARTPFRLYWEASYDCTASGDLGPDGVYRGWLSTEFRGCGNGHYWLLLDGFHAVFAEDD